MYGFYSDNPEKDYDRYIEHQDYEEKRRRRIEEDMAVKCVGCKEWTDPDLLEDGYCDECLNNEEE